MSASDLICKAITHRRRLAFTYKDGVRVVDPYILGHDTGNALVLSAVQVSGGSGSGFRTFLVDNIVGLEIVDQRFWGSHPDYNPNDRLFTRVLCQV